MIRINLLPVRAFKRKERVKTQLLIYFLSVMLAVGAMGALYFLAHRTYLETEKKKTELIAEKKRMLALVTRVKIIRAELAAIEEKLVVMDNLIKRRSGPVRVLDEISARTPADRAWLESMVQKANGLTLKGMAMDNPTIAEFMSNLEKSKYLKNVELVRSQQKIIEDIRLKSFTITCAIDLGEKATPEK